MIVRIRWSTRRAGAFYKGILPSPKLLLTAALLATGAPVRTAADVRIVQVHRDGAVDWVTAFMQKRDFIQPYYAREMVQSAVQNDLPTSLLVCIELLESSGGKVFTGNPFGWDNGKAVFVSQPAAIAYISAQLGSGRYYAGKSIPEKLEVYNPRPGYAGKVMSCMKKFKPAS